MFISTVFSARSAWLDRLATPWRLGLALAAAILLQAAMWPLDRHLHQLSGGLGKPSLAFGSSAGTLLAHLHAMGAAGRRTLVWLYAIDLLFPTALALTAIQAAWLAFRRTLPDVALLLAALAVAFDGLDLLEKLTSFLILARFPRLDSAWLTLAVTLTSIKLICLAMLYAGLLASLLAWVLPGRRQRA